MDNVDKSELLKYLNGDDFVKQHKAESEEDTRSLVEMIADGIKRDVQNTIESIEIDWGVWEPSQKLKAEAKRREAILEHDATRPDIKDLKFEALPKERAQGLKGGFLALSWNQFVEELGAGRAEVAEVLIVDYMNIKLDDTNEDYYFKVADLEGNVCKGGVRKVDYNKLGMVRYESTSPSHDDYVAYFRWDWPEDYVESHPGRPEDEYKLYELVFMANGMADKIKTDHRKHAYVLHYKKKGKDIYGLITKEELDDLKKLKDAIGLMDPEYCFKANNNKVLDFTW